MQVLISLTAIDNAYQQEQPAATEGSARWLGVTSRIAHADNDAIKQSEQLQHRLGFGRVLIRPLPSVSEGLNCAVCTGALC